MGISKKGKKALQQLKIKPSTSFVHRHPPAVSHNPSARTKLLETIMLEESNYAYSINHKPEWCILAKNPSGLSRSLEAITFIGSTSSFLISSEKKHLGTVANSRRERGGKL